MARSLPNHVVAEVQRLLQQGLSRRATARQVGISRGTASNIASGRRQLQEPPAKELPADSPDDAHALKVDLDGDARKRYLRLKRKKNREQRRGLI